LFLFIYFTIFSYYFGVHRQKTHTRQTETCGFLVSTPIDTRPNAILSCFIYLYHLIIADILRAGQ